MPLSMDEVALASNIWILLIITDVSDIISSSDNVVSSGNNTLHNIYQVNRYEATTI